MLVDKWFLNFAFAPSWQRIINIGRVANFVDLSKYSFILVAFDCVTFLEIFIAIRMGAGWGVYGIMVVSERLN